MDIDMKGIEEDETMKEKLKNKLTVNDFSVISTIGKGSYGKVLLVKKNDNDKIYAMKILKKKEMMKRKQVEHIKTERKILELIDHPFIIKLRHAFQNEHKLYLVMDYCHGGELFFHISRIGRFNEEVVKFYTAQLIFAIEHLHKFDIIYRDLKPENVLIDRTGYVKLTDFGLSKENIADNHSTHSFCGTPEYLAPEIVMSKGHGKAVDWWSLGAIMYEMLTGMPPFYSDDREKLFKKIQEVKVNYPLFLSKNAVDLLQKIFVKDPDQRLGSGHEGVSGIKAHPFFSNIDWEAIYEQKIKPPFIPKIRSETDVKYIDPEFTMSGLKESENIIDGNEYNIDNHYSGFSYDSSKKEGLFDPSLNKDNMDI